MKNNQKKMKKMMVNNETFHILLDNRGFDAIAWKLTKYSFLLAVQKMLELDEVKKSGTKRLSSEGPFKCFWK